MAAVNIKITDLNIVQPNQIAESDMFLRSVKAGNVSAQSAQYVSKTVELSSIAECFLRKERKQLGVWNFVNANKPPISTTRFNPVNLFKEYVVGDPAQGVESTRYSNSATFFPETSTLSSFTANNFNNGAVGNTNPIIKKNQFNQDSIVNLDYVNKLIYLCHKDLLNTFTTLVTKYYHATATAEQGKILPSFVGMLVFTTKLNSEESLRNLYGNNAQIIIDVENNIKIKLPNTRWAKHSSSGNDYYVFRAATSAKAKSYAPDGKTSTEMTNDDRKLPLLKHSHSITKSHGHSVNGSRSSSCGTSAMSSLKGNRNGDKDHNWDFSAGSHPAYLNGNTTNSIKVSGSTSISMGKITNGAATRSEFKNAGIPIVKPTKFVYVWERVS